MKKLMCKIFGHVKGDKKDAVLLMYDERKDQNVFTWGHSCARCGCRCMSTMGFVPKQPNYIITIDLTA